MSAPDTNAPTGPILHTRGYSDLRRMLQIDQLSVWKVGSRTKTQCLLVAGRNYLLPLLPESRSAGLRTAPYNLHHLAAGKSADRTAAGVVAARV